MGAKVQNNFIISKQKEKKHVKYSKVYPKHESRSREVLSSHKKIPNKFGFSFGLHYLCSQIQKDNGKRFKISGSRRGFQEASC